MTVGDAHQLENVQSVDSLVGTILRLNLDGTIPEDNPYAENYIYSYGHRNPQGLVWTSDDTMYASEHGDSANDEINHIEAGKNYGWPIIEGQDEQAGMEVPHFPQEQIQPGHLQECLYGTINYMLLHYEAMRFLK